MTSMDARQNYTYFRKRLLREGFHQLQNSLYVRHYPTLATAEATVYRLKNFIPEGAKAVFFLVTDKQYSMSLEFYGQTPLKLRPDAPEQVELF
jgi:CRISPR-associated protein Cas2